MSLILGWLSDCMATVLSPLVPGLQDAGHNGVHSGARVEAVPAGPPGSLCLCNFHPPVHMDPHQPPAAPRPVHGSPDGRQCDPWRSSSLTGMVCAHVHHISVHLLAGTCRGAGRLACRDRITLLSEYWIHRAAQCGMHSSAHALSRRANHCNSTATRVGL